MTKEEEEEQILLFKVFPGALNVEKYINNTTVDKSKEGKIEYLEAMHKLQT